jgi:hypothetical protein
MYSMIGFGNTQTKIEGLYTMIILESGFELIDMGNSPLGHPLRPSPSLVETYPPLLHLCPSIANVHLFYYYLYTMFTYYIVGPMAIYHIYIIHH